MKNFCFLLLLITTTTVCFSQDTSRKGYFNNVKVGFLMRLAEDPELSGLSKNGSGTEISTINGFYVNSHVGIGIGLGLSTYVNPTLTTIPLYADVHYYFSKSRRSPFFFADCGYSFVTKDNLTGGLLVNSGAGYSFRLGRKSLLSPELGYRWQSYRIGGVAEIDGSISSVSVGATVSF